METYIKMFNLQKNDIDMGILEMDKKENSCVQMSRVKSLFYVRATSRPVKDAQMLQMIELFVLLNGYL